MGYDRIVSSTLLRESRITILSVTRQTQSIVGENRSSRLTTKIIKLTMLTVANPLTEGTAISRIPPFNYTAINLHEIYSPCSFESATVSIYLLNVTNHRALTSRVSMNWIRQSYFLTTSDMS